MDTREWQQRLKRTFGGRSGIIGEGLSEVDASETSLGARYVTTLAGFPVLTESYFELAYETLQLVAASTRPPESFEDKFFTAAHLYAFRRARAGYLLYLRTHHAESVSLLRGIWELTNSMLAVRKGVVSVAELFGGSPTVSFLPDDPKEQRKAFKKVIQSAEGRIHTYILGEKSGLSEKAREKLDGIRETLHQAVHRSNMNFAHYWLPWVLGRKPLALLQEYDIDVVTLNTNLTWMVLWPLLRTMKYLRPILDAPEAGWDDRYGILDDSFRHAIGNFPKESARAVEEFVRVHFDAT